MVPLDEYKNALSHYATGITVVTTYQGGEMLGLTVNSFTSVSLEPPLVLFCLEKTYSKFDHFLENNFYVVNILAYDQTMISKRFASHISDKFEGINFSQNDFSIPMIEGAIYYVECKKQQTVDAGDHVVIIAEVTKTKKGIEKPPLTYFQRNYNNCK